MLANFIHTLFYLFPILFIWAEIYHLRFKDRLYVKFNQKHLSTSKLTDYIFYVTKVFYLIWLIIGLFSSLSYYFLLIIIVSSIKFLVLFFKSRKFNDIYDMISSLVCIGLLSYLFLKGIHLIL